MPRGRHTALTVSLTVDDRQTLRAWQRSTTMPVGRARRGQIILLLADGMPVVEIADTVGVTHRVVYKWGQRFLQHGIEGLADKPGRGRPPVLTTPVQSEQVSQRRRARTRRRQNSHHRAARSALSRGRKTSLTITLTPDERETLTRWQRATTIRAAYAKRGRMLLLLADGLSVVQVATMVGLTRRFVYQWARRFLQHGIEGLIDKPGRGRRPRLTTPTRGQPARQRQQGTDPQQAVLEGAASRAPDAAQRRGAGAGVQATPASALPPQVMRAAEKTPPRCD